MRCSASGMRPVMYKYIGQEQPIFNLIIDKYRSDTGTHPFHLDRGVARWLGDFVHMIRASYFELGEAVDPTTEKSQLLRTYVSRILKIVEDVLSGGLSFVPPHSHILSR